MIDIFDIIMLVLVLSMFIILLLKIMKFEEIFDLRVKQETEVQEAIVENMKKSSSSKEGWEFQDSEDMPDFLSSLSEEELKGIDLTGWDLKEMFNSTEMYRAILTGVLSENSPTMAYIEENFGSEYMGLAKPLILQFGGAFLEYLSSAGLSFMLKLFSKRGTKKSVDYTSKEHMQKYEKPHKRYM